MIRRLIILLCITAYATLAFSQSVDDPKKKINTIKKSSAYIYAETTLENEQDALELAQELLYQRVNEYIATKKKFKNAKEAVIINQNYATERIQLPRGNMYRAFLYVKKTDIIPTDNAIVGKVDNKEEMTSTIEILQNPDEEDALREILELKTLDDMKTRLPEFKSEGKIISYAKYSELANPDNFILIVYDKKGQIKAVLSDGKQRKNLKTNSPDDIRNYKGTGAVGVRIN